MFYDIFDFHIHPDQDAARKDRGYVKTVDFYIPDNETFLKLEGEGGHWAVIRVKYLCNHRGSESILADQVVSHYKGIYNYHDCPKGMHFSVEIMSGSVITKDEFLNLKAKHT